MIVPTKSTRFLTDNFQRIFNSSWSLGHSLGGLTWGASWWTCSGGSLRDVSGGGLIRGRGEG